MEPLKVYLLLVRLWPVWYISVVKFLCTYHIFFSDVNIVSLSMRSKPLIMLPSLPLFLTNSISNSYMDLSLVLGIQKKVKTTPTREVEAHRNITPLVPKMLMRLGNA